MPNVTTMFFSPDQPEVTLLRDLLRTGRRLLVTTHRRPDGDAIGSLLATARALRALTSATTAHCREERVLQRISPHATTVTAHTPDPPPAFLSFLQGFSTITQDPGQLPDYDLILALDHSELSRTGLALDLLDARIPVVAIDHHATFDQRATIALVAPGAAATSELLTELFPLLGLPIDAETATCLLTGLVGDTGSFQHPNTSARVLALAGQLLERGADLRAIVTHLFGHRTFPALRVIGRALERLEVHAETGAVISVVTHADLEECGATVDDLAGVVNLLKTIPEARFSLLLTETAHGKLTGSLRSDSDRAVDVSAIARRFGGGGHTLASGFEIAGRLIQDAHGWHIE